MLIFAKKYQLWVRDGQTAAFVPTEFDTLNECIVADKSGEWYITKGVSLVVQEAGENVTSPAIPYHVPEEKLKETPPIVPGLADEELTPEQIAYASAGGKIGNIT